MDNEDDISYMALTPGTRVLSSDGSLVGEVERVLDIPELDLFDGIVIETPNGDRFVDRDHVTRITTAAVYCAFTAEEASSLPVPDSAPTFRADPRQDGSRSIMGRMKRKFGRAKWTRDHDDE
jgi:hypothetical protein